MGPGFALCHHPFSFKRQATYVQELLLSDNAGGQDIRIQPIKTELTVCKVADYTEVDLHSPYVFTGRTDQEASLVCPADMVPSQTLERSNGWRAFRIQGVLDFSLIGILAPIATILADKGIGIFAVSTYNTDYVLTKAEDFPIALDALSESGYTII